MMYHNKNCQLFSGRHIQSPVSRLRSPSTWIRINILCLIIFAVIIFFGCAARTPFDWGNSQSGYRLAYRSGKGDVFNYRIIQNSHRTYSYGEQVFESSNEKQFSYELKAKKIRGVLSFIMTIDSLYESFEHPQSTIRPDYSAYFGKRAKVTLTSAGVQKPEKTKLIDPIPAMDNDVQTKGKKPEEKFKLDFFHLPDRWIKTGDSWTETRTDTAAVNDTTQKSFYTSITDYEYNYTALGEENRMELACLHIRQETFLKTLMSGKMAGNEMSTEGEGEIVKHIWFAYREGILVEISAENLYEGTTAFTGQVTAVTPQTSESTMSLKLTQWSPKER